MNDEINFFKVIDKYSEMIYHIAIRYLENIEDAKDIVQEVLVRYIDYIKSGKDFNDDEHEKNWIVRVTINLCYNEITCARNRYNVTLENEVQDFTTTIGFDSELQEVIQKLDKKYRTVFELFYIEDMKISQIGKILNISEANVKTRLKRAREKVKDTFNKERRNHEKR